MTDIGYRFIPEYWVIGIATVVSEALLKYGFQELDLVTVYAMAIPENIASNKVLTKIGLIFIK